MALSKVKVNDNGVTTTYHKVNNVNLVNGRLTCTLNSYVSKDYRVAEQPADTSVFNFKVTVEEEEAMGIRALCYNKIKALETWSDAVDC